MSNESDSVLVEEIDEVIDGIKNGKSAKCESHEVLSRGIIVLLRVARIQLRMKARVVAVAAVASTVSSVITGVVLGVLKAYGKV